MFKRVMAWILVAALCCSIVPVQTFAAQTQTPEIETEITESLPEESVPETTQPEETAPEETEPTPTVSRAQWISALTKTFDMQVDEDNFPDNYFTDLTEASPYYFDMLLAVEFGVLDIPAGYPVYPDDPATRDFAASTLNYCLSFQLEDTAGYTYTDAAETQDPVSAQIALNRGWFMAVDGAFCPALPITEAEMAGMLADAASVLTKEEVDPNYNSTFTLAEGVIEVPADTKMNGLSGEVLELTDCPVQINAGDLFIVYNGTLPVALKALEVQTQDNVTTIRYTHEGAEDAIADCDYEGVVDVDLSTFEGSDEVTYTLAEQPVTFARTTRDISYDQSTQTLKATKTADLGQGLNTTISVTVKNLRLEIKDNRQTGDYRCVLKGDASLTNTVTAKSFAPGGAPTQVYMGRIYILGIGYLSLSVIIDINGELILNWEGDMKLGFAHRLGEGTRFIRSFHKKEFSFDVRVNASCALRLSAGVDVLLFDASMWLQVGVKMGAESITRENGIPKECFDLAGHMFAEVGYTGEIRGVKKFEEPLLPIFTEDNSPIRVHYHIEDSVQVYACTHDSAPAYYTPPSSGNFNPPVGSGIYDKTRLYYYELDDYDRAYITAYCGKSTTPVIPDTVDGYPVVGIDDYVFWGNPDLRAVMLPSSLLYIGTGAFMECENLRLVFPGSSLNQIGESAFEGCTSLLRFEMPDTVTEVGANAFSGCSSLEEVIFSPNVYAIEDYTFAGCTSLKSLELGEGNRTIGEGAFYGCTNLSSINLGGIFAFGSRAFWNCTSLTELDLTEITSMYFGDEILNYGSIEDGGDLMGEYVFGGCSGVKSVIFSPNTYKLWDRLLQGCTGLESVTIPDSAVIIGKQVFEGCTSLKTVTVPESVERIYPRAFANCKGLTRVTFPDYLYEIPAECFAGCTSLKEVNLPLALKYICGGAFYNCVSLPTIEITNWTTDEYYSPLSRSGYTVFEGCVNLNTVSFSNRVRQIPSSILSNCPGVEQVTMTDYVEGIQTAAFANCPKLTDIRFSPNITFIEDHAFEGCTSLQTVDLPDALKTIGQYAFASCSYLEDVNFADSISYIDSYAFAYNPSIEVLELPLNLSELRDLVFYQCSGLSEVFIPKKLGTAGDRPFLQCDNLKTVRFEEGITAIANNLFYDCDGPEIIEIPDTVREIRQYAFGSAGNLKTVIFHGPVKTIGEGAFAATALQWLDLPEGLTSIGYRAFTLCHDLEYVRLPETLGFVDDEAFMNCNLLSLQLPSRLVAIGNDAFRNNSFEEVRLPKSVLAVGERAFGFYPPRIILDEDATKVPDGLFSETGITSTDVLVLPETVTELGNKVFSGCASLQSAVIPEQITKIGSSVFYNCAALKEVTMGSRVSQIGSDIFYNCAALETVALSAGLTELPDRTFHYCPALKELEIPSNVTRLGADIFWRCNSLTKVVTGPRLTQIDEGYDPWPSNVELYGIADSYAAQWAEEKGHVFHEIRIPIQQIALPQSQITICTGSSIPLKPVLTPAGANETIVYTSSAPEIAAVSADGVLTGIAVGEAVIQATAGSLSATCRVTVQQGVTAIELNTNQLELLRYNSFQLVARVYPENAANKELIWQSNDPNVIVDSDGTVSSDYSSGSAVITVTAADGSGVSQTCTVNLVVNNVVSDPAKLQSPHNYQNNTYGYWTYTNPAATSLILTFDERTAFEESNDYLHVYTADGTLVGTYTGTELAGQQVTVPGNTAMLCLVTNGSTTAWGFGVTSAEAILCDHQYIHTVTAPTCNEGGFTTHTCSLCAHTYQDSETPAAGHDYQTTESGEATCTEPYQVIHTCANCSRSYLSSYTAPLGHEWSDWEEESQSSCTQNGSEIRTCLRCTSAEHRPLPLTDHDWEFSAVIKEPTSDAEGESLYICRHCDATQNRILLPCPEHSFSVWYDVVSNTCTEGGIVAASCDLCGYFKQKESEPLGHGWDYGTIHKVPTPEAPGQVLFTCLRCGETKIEEMTEENHPHTFLPTETVEATCTTPGYTIYACPCGKSYEDDYTDLLEHSFTSEVFAPDCWNQGYTLHTCTRCGHCYSDNFVPVTEHSYDVQIVPPDCWNRGYTLYICTICGQQNYDDYTPVTEHSFDTQVTAPTCWTEGYTTYTCTLCGYVYYDDSVPALEHDYQATVTPPSCIAQGYTTYTCVHCGDSYTSDYVAPTEHSYQITVCDPTCTEDGYTDYFCPTCYSSYQSDFVPALGHDYASTVKEPTCTEGGYIRYSCSVCGHSYTGQTMNPLGHDWQEGDVLQEPTESQPGLIRITCSRCDKTSSREIPPLSHIHSYTAESVRPTCTEDGYTRYTCSGCGDSYDDDFTAALGHSYEITVFAPDCTQGGYTVYCCDICQDRYETDFTPPAGHSYTTFVNDPTCTEAGSTLYLCEQCGHSYTADPTPASGHRWDIGQITLEPAVGTEGEKTYTCINCGEIRTESIPALPDQPAEEPCRHASTKIVNFKDATCTAEGYTGDKVCSICGETVEKGSVIGVKAHTEVIDKAASATCTADGKTEGRHCSVCQSVLVEQETIPATGHSWDQWTLTKPATSETEGEETRVCSVCAQTETRPVDKLTHPFTDVAPGKFYETPILWAVENGVTNGTSATTFAPNDKCTRAHVVTFLWRAAGAPEPTSTSNPFVDVIEGKFYYKAVLWAVENGITNGVDATHFGTSGECTRGQVATFLWRTMGKPQPTSTTNPFSDVQQGKFYYTAVLWAAENGITSGVGGGKFAPDDTCTRGQIVTFLFRALA